MAKRASVGVRGSFDAVSAGRFPELGTLPGVAGVRLDGDFVYEEQFFDTVDLRLASKGIVLFRRSGGPGQGWHLERLDEPERVEPLGTHSEPPEALTGQLQFHLRGQKLIPSVDVTIVRRVSRLVDSAGTVIASVGDEHHRAEPLITDGQARTWRLWDYEVLGEREDRLADHLRAALLDAGGRTAVRSSSLSTLGGAVHGAPRRSGGLKPRGKARRVFSEYFADQLAELAELDPALRMVEPEAVHDFRVALRRVRTCLSAFRKDLDADTRRALNDELRWLGHVLGQVRDAGVMRERLRRRLEEEAPELVLGPVSRGIEEHLGAEHREAAEALAEALASNRYFHLLDALDRLARLADDGYARLQTKPAVAVVVRRDARRLRAAIAAVERGAGREDGRAEHDKALHEVRKSAKKVRYAAELARPFGRKKARRLEKKAHKIQKVLGEHQDCVVTADLIRRLGVEAYGRGENAFTFGRLHAAELRRAEEAETRYKRLRRKLPRKLRGRA